jgi:hypothetical protein
VGAGLGFGLNVLNVAPSSRDARRAAAGVLIKRVSTRCQQVLSFGVHASLHLGPAMINASRTGIWKTLIQERTVEGWVFDAFYLES